MSSEDLRHETAAAALLGVAAGESEKDNKKQSQSQPPAAAASSATSSQEQPRNPASTSSSAPGYPIDPRPHPETQILSMSSIGFGIDSSNSSSWGDGTEAAIRALQDSMERSTLRLPMSASSHNLQISVVIGVPPKQPGSADPMHVDVSRLSAVLPPSIPVQPIRVVVGGIFLPGSTAGAPSICTATACVTLESSQAPAVVMPSAHSVEVKDPHPANPWSGLSQAAAISAATSSVSPPLAPAHLGGLPLQSHSVAATTAAAFGSLPYAVQPMATAQTALPPLHPPLPRRNTSIEMLAKISSEMHASAPARSTSSLTGKGGNNKSHRRSSEPAGSQLSVASGGSDWGSEDPSSSNYNYKKLPPGNTSKNNKRLFVKHKYRDYCKEPPLPEEHDLVVGPTAAPAARTTNAAFPLKLHETLAQIEEDGYSDIVGWMPHGRSFKIHKQKEFSEIILPKYFVMTKKSSFLRQLNLYGFNRFSAGYDQGSYYHERFLRGLKFLCRRMSRQKVNGNRIRSAGNPDEEPDLQAYPSCPPTNSHRNGASLSSPSSPQTSTISNGSSSFNGVPAKQRSKSRSLSRDDEDPTAGTVTHDSVDQEESESSEEHQEANARNSTTSRKDGLQVPVPMSG